MQKPTFQVETERGQKVTAHGMTVVPIAQTVRVKTPFGVWEWARPVGVNVEREGRYERVPLWDVTRLLQIVLYLISLIGLIAIWQYHQQSKETTHG